MTTLIQLSDLHFGAEDALALRLASEHIRDDPPDALVVCGDLTQRGKRREFAAAREWLDGFGLPQLVVPGNHDTPLLNLPARMTDPFERYRDHFGEAAPELAVGDWHVAGINTARGWQARANWAEGVVNLEDLSGRLAGATSRRIIVCHHPFVSPPQTPLRTSTRRGREADAMLQESAAALLLTGHVHAPSASLRRTPAGAYLAISAGTLSSRLRDHPPGFNRLILEKDALQAEAFESFGGRLVRRPLGQWSLADIAGLPRLRR